MNLEKETLYQFLKTVVDKYSAQIAFRTRAEDKSWHEYSYAEWYRWIQEISMGLVQVGAKPKSKIALIADNRVEWMVCSMAITTIGCVDVPRGTDATFEDLEYILNHTEADILIAENDRVIKNLQKDIKKFSSIKTIIMLEGKKPNIKGKKAYTLAEIRSEGSQVLQNKGEKAYHDMGKKVKPDDLATIIYTSGTTGNPKGVMLLNSNLVWEAQIARDAADLKPGDSTMCFLPPWHIAERLLESAMLWAGGTGNCTTIPQMVKDLADCKPTFLVSVPRVWENMYNKIHDGVEKKGGIAKLLFTWAETGAISYTLAKEHLAGRVVYFEKPGPGETLKKLLYALRMIYLIPGNFLAQVLLGKIRKTLGGHIRLAVSGAGALPHKVDLFFRAAGVPIIEAYGMTETTGVSTFREVDNNKFKTLGPPAKGIEIQLRTEDGQVIHEPGVKGVAWHRGPHIMKGYYKEPKKTKETIDKDGWLNSGDLLMRSLTGEYAFAGRAKDTIVLLGGENLEPEPIETKLKESPYVSQCMVVGQDQKVLGVLITPAEENLQDWAAKQGVDLGDRKKWNENAEVHKLFRGEIKRLISTQNGFKSFEKVQHFYIVPKEFEPGQEMTQTMKIRRNIVTDMYEKEIASLFE